jgi:hypothetical protein
MKPLKFSEIVEETAKRLERPVNITGVMLRLYFKEVRGALTSLSYPSVQVLNLGTFSLKPRTVEKKLHRKRELLEKLLLEPVRTRLIREEVVQEIGELENVLGLIINEKERKKTFKKSKQLPYE